MSQVMFLQTTLDIWSALEKRYASASQSHIFQLGHQLFSDSKGNQTKQQYLNYIKGLADTLAMINEPLRDQDLVYCIL